MLKKLATFGVLVLVVRSSLAQEVGNSSYAYWFGPGAESSPVIGVSARGDIAVAWVGADSEGTRDIIYSIKSVDYRFTPGNPPFAPHPANSTTGGDQLDPTVAMDATGNFLIAWESNGSIRARRFSVTGEPVGGEFQVEETGSDVKSQPTAGMDAFGNFVIAWVSTGTGASRIVARRFLADGTPLSGEIPIDHGASSQLDRPALAMGSWGEFVIAWEVTRATGLDIAARSYASDGTPDGPEFDVANLPAQARGTPTVAMDAHGRFVVAWHGSALDGTHEVRARQFLAGGDPIASDFVVNTQPTPDVDTRVSVATDASGDFIVTWDGVESPDRRQWFKQQFRHDGSRAGYEGWGWYGQARTMHAAMDADGDAYVAFTDQTPGSPSYAMARHFIGVEPVDLQVSATDDRDAVEPGEMFAYTVTITNLHPVSTETGIPEVDAAIGVAVNASLASQFSGLRFVQLPETCYAYGYPGYAACVLPPVPAGGQITLTLNAQAGEEETATHSLHAYAQQFDPLQSNNFASDTNAIACAEGNSRGSFVFTDGPRTVEEGESVLIGVERVGGNCGAAQVLYLTGNSPDSPASSGTLDWGPGESGIRTFRVETTEDNIDEEAQDLWVTAGTLRTAITLLDDDPTPTVTITPVAQTVTEGPGSRIQLRISLSNPTESAVWLPLTWSGTAMRATDYEHFGSTHLGLPSMTLEHMFSIAVYDDLQDEYDETLTLTFGQPATAVLIGATSHSFTLVDNDAPPEVAISSADASRGEGGSISVALRLSEKSGKPITVPLVWGGTAVRGSDFSAPDSVTFVTGFDTASFDIRTIADTLDEDDKTVELTLGIPTNSGLGADSRFNLTIIDDDASPFVNFTTTAQSIDENADAATMTLWLTRASGREVRVSISHSAASGEARLGEDYGYAGGVLSFAAGETTKTVPLQVIDDANIELDEGVTFTLEQPVNAQVGGYRQNRITILDDDPNGAVRSAVR